LPGGETVWGRSGTKQVRQLQQQVIVLYVPQPP
jgi:hypothetical protein